MYSFSIPDYVPVPDDNSSSNNVEEIAYADNTIITNEEDRNGMRYVCHVEEEVIHGYNIVPLINSLQNNDMQDNGCTTISKVTKARKRKNVTFNLGGAQSNDKSLGTKGNDVKNTRTRRKKQECETIVVGNNLTDLSDNITIVDIKQGVEAKKPRRSRIPKKYIDIYDTNSANSNYESTDLINLDISNANDVVDNEPVKVEFIITQENDPEYKPERESMYGSDSDIDTEEREFVINGRRNSGGKKKVSDSIYLKRQSETLKKIKTEVDWKETLTVNDLIFYNPASNPMTNPPDISVVNKNEKIVDIEKENDLSEDEETADNPEPVPQLKIGPDGKLIIDPKSLIIEETGLKKSKKRLEQSEALLESKYTIKKIDNLYTKRKMRPLMNEWGPEDTIMFYRALNTIGTDFSMMATLFENRTRADIKRKFKLEERKNPSLLSKALRNFNNFDIDELKSELDADKRRIQRIKEEEVERKKMLKEEKKMEKMAQKRSKQTIKHTSMCGKLTQDSSLSKLPKYIKPHPKIFELLKASQSVCS